MNSSTAAHSSRRKARYAANHTLRLLKAALNRAFKANRAILGFRTSSKTWIARLHPAGGERLHKPLGAEADMDFEQAHEAALAWFNTASGPAPAQVTVAQAGSSYLTHLHDEKALGTEGLMRIRDTQVRRKI